VLVCFQVTFSSSLRNWVSRIRGTCSANCNLLNATVFNKICC
jgi:hypothetical protein